MMLLSLYFSLWITNYAFLNIGPWRKVNILYINNKYRLKSYDLNDILHLLLKYLYNNL